MMQRLFALAAGLLATAGGIALTPRVALNTRPQLRFAHAAPAPLGCAPSNFSPSTRCAPPKMQEAAATPAEPAGESPKIMKKLLPLGAMFFFILFNYTILRDTKDVLVVTGSLIQQALIFGLGSLAVATPYLAVILATIVVVWIRAARKLNVQFIDAMEKVGEEV